MATFVMLTRLAHGTLRTPETLEDLERRVMERIREESPEVEWLGSYAVLGPYDYLDLFRAADTEEAMRVATVVRTFGHAHTEVWAAIEWQRFKEIVRDMTPDPGPEI